MNDRQEYKKAAMIAFGNSFTLSTKPLTDFSKFCAEMADQMVREDQAHEEKTFGGLRNSQDPMSSPRFGRQ